MERNSQMDAMALLSRYRGAVMGIAALWVVLLHCWIQIVPYRPILGTIEDLFKWNGTLGVEIFFFYSGLGLTYSIRKGTLKQYYAQRARRILFPYWFMCAVHAVTWGWDGIKTLKIATGAAFLTESIFAFLWFVPAIFLLYMLFPAYHALLRRAEDETAFTLCALCVWLCASILLRDTLRYDLWSMTNRIPCFLLGIWFGEHYRRKELCLTAVHWVLFVLTFAVGWLLRDAGNKSLITLIPEFDFVPSVFLGVSLCFLFSGVLAAMEGAKGWFGRGAALLVRFLSAVGAFSLELYCVHQWLYGYLYSALEGHVTYLTINIITIPILVFAGWMLGMLHRLFWRVVGWMKGKK